METVIVIGGGASGMMAALTAAEGGDKHVILLERQLRVGRKLLATGNGRCNLTNTGASAENYHGENPEFAVPALSKFPPESVLDFFRSLGLVTVTEYGGRVYPLSNSANSVVDVLRFALNHAGVEVRTACPAREIYRCSIGYDVVCDDESLHADYLIVSCGGAAGAKLGGVCDGYELLKPLGHKRTRLCPSLVQLVADSEYPRALKGIRAAAELRLFLGDELIGKSSGELQFTDNGVSGPAVFDISRAASLSGEGCILHINFMSACSRVQVKELLKQRCRNLPELEAQELFTGMLHNRLGRMLTRYCGISPAEKLSSLSDESLEKAVSACMDFVLRIKGSEGLDSAQVTAGGIKTGGFNPETLESWFMPGLFVCGELLDIDGDCGGYNLQWAWASGRLAGRLGR